MTRSWPDRPSAATAVAKSPIHEFQSPVVPTANR